MTGAPAQMKLGAFLMAGGHHIAAWRHPLAQARAGVDLTHFIGLAQAAERAHFDCVFFEDAAAIRERNPRLAAQAARSAHFEPLSLLAALAVHTSRIGLVATASTTYNEPAGLARSFATLDHLSAGRAGWNLVTSASELEAENFASSGLRPHAERYARAAQFADTIVALWEGWPSPQGRPVMVQAGASEVGKELAARTADVVFSAAQTFAESRAFYGDLKSRLAKYGRGPDDLKIMPGVSPIVGATLSAARAKYEELQELIPDQVGVGLLASYLSIQDLSQYDVNGPLPDLPPTDGIQSRQQLIVDQGRRENLSIQQLARQFAGARGHWQLIGTPAQIADELEARFRGGAADGFNIMPPLFPGGLDDFIAGVIPELRRRGLVRAGYAGATLRENLGLRMPARSAAALGLHCAD